MIVRSVVAFANQRCIFGIGHVEVVDFGHNYHLSNIKHKAFAKNYCSGDNRYIV